MKVLIACGGTGGHVFPGVALAECFEEKFIDVDILFVGTPRGLEKEILGKGRWKLEMIASPSLADKKGWQKLGIFFQLIRSLRESRKLLKRERPALVIGVGGYASAPVMMMAGLMKIPTVALEPNTIPGIANRYLRPFVDLFVVAFPGMDRFFGKKTRWIGIPVRKSVLKISVEEKPSNKKVILVFGGSQGAQKINEAVLQALSELGEMKEELHFIHLIGARMVVGEVEEVYHSKGFSAEVYPFLKEMGPVYHRADFVIARSGANTIAELKVLRKPALLIPFPHAAGNHQERNARSLEKSGGTKVLLDHEVSGNKMATIIRDVFRDPTFLEMMKENLKRFGTENPSERIVEECMKLVKHV